MTNSESTLPPAADVPRGADQIPDEHQVLAGRLKEAREYVGLLQEEVADALGIPRASVSALEAGKRRVSGVELRRLARLYRRPVSWLLGEEVAEVRPDEALYRATATLSERDKEQVLRFAEFLAAAQRPSRRQAASPALGSMEQAARQSDEPRGAG